MSGVIGPGEETDLAGRGRRVGRARDANRARAAILDAGETVFARHGFAGARVDGIAQASGYNVSLLFQYFGDKLRLYAAVLQRAHQETTELQVKILAPVGAGRAVLSEAPAFRGFLATVVRVTFDYLVEHPRLRRILTWEMAEGWQTYARIASQFLPDAGDRQLAALFQDARRAGWLRSDSPALIQLTLVFQVCQSYLAFLPLYQALLPGEDVASPLALARAREQVVQFIVGGLLVDRPAAQADRGEAP